MIENKKILVVGAGGFIGGHLVRRLRKNKNSIIAVDIKPKEYWFQDYDDVENHYSIDIQINFYCLLNLFLKNLNNLYLYM